MNKQNNLYNASQFEDNFEIPRFNTENKNHKKKNPIKEIIAVCILLLLFLIILYQAGIFRQSQVIAEEPKKPAKPVVAGNLFPELGDAQYGHLAGMTKEKILEQMQIAADANYFSFKINTQMIFENGRSEGNVGIENPNYNVYPMVVQIFLGENGEDELIYDSGGILPNQHIQRAKLAKELPEGNYPAIAYLYAYDPDTLINIFKSAAALEIIVNN